MVYRQRGLGKRKRGFLGITASNRKLSLLGVSVHHITTDFVKEVEDAGLSRNSSIMEIENLNDYDTYGVIRRKGTGVVCPIDEETSAAYVHSIPHSDVGVATFMLSYAWTYRLVDIVETLVEYCELYKSDPKDTFVWIDCLCINQHRVTAKRRRGENIPFEFFQSQFEGKVKDIGHILAMMAPWQAPTYLTRAYCVLELFTASENDCLITIGMPPREKHDFIDGMRGESAAQKVNELLEALGTMDVRKARAWAEDDRTNIMRLVRDGVGYETFNATVSKLLKDWALGVIVDEVEVGAGDAGDSGAQARRRGSLLNNAAELFRQIGEFDRTLATANEALRVNELAYGRQNKHTAKSIELVGVALYWKGEKEEAMKWMKDSLRIRDEVLGREHGETADSVSRIAVTLNYKGEKEEAMKMHREALQIRQKVFGKEHAKTAQSLSSIASMLKAKGKVEEALKMFKEVLQIREKVLGKQHTHTAGTIINIARILYNTGEKMQALEMYEQAFLIYEKVLGSDHYHTILTRINHNVARISLDIENK